MVVMLDAVDCPTCGRLIDPIENRCMRCHAINTRPAPEVPAWLIEQFCHGWLARGPHSDDVFAAVDRAASGPLNDLRTWVALEVIDRARRNQVLVADQVKRMVATCERG